MTVQFTSSELRAYLEKEMRVLIEDNEALRGMTIRLEKEKHGLQKRNLELETSTKLLEQQVKDYTEENQHLNGSLRALGHQVGNIAEERDKTTAKVSEVEGAKSALAQELDKLRSHDQEQRQQIQQQAKEIQRLQEEARVSSDERDALERKIGQYKRAAEVIEEQVVELETSRRLGQQRVEETNEQINKLQFTVTTNNQYIHELEERVQLDSKNLKALETEKMQKEVELRQRDMDNQRLQDSLQYETQQYRHKVESEKQHLQLQLQHDSQQLQDRLAADNRLLHEQLNQAVRERDDLSHKLVNHDREAEGLRTKLRAMETEATTAASLLSQQNAQLEGSIAHLQTQMSEKEHGDLLKAQMDSDALRSVQESHQLLANENARLKQDVARSEAARAVERSNGNVLPPRPVPHQGVLGEDEFFQWASEVHRALEQVTVNVQGGGSQMDVLASYLNQSKKLNRSKMMQMASRCKRHLLHALDICGEVVRSTVHQTNVASVLHNAYMRQWQLHNAQPAPPPASYSPSALSSMSPEGLMTYQLSPANLEYLASVLRNRQSPSSQPHESRVETPAVDPTLRTSPKKERDIYDSSSSSDEEGEHRASPQRTPAPVAQPSPSYSQPTISSLQRGVSPQRGNSPNRTSPIANAPPVPPPMYAYPVPYPYGYTPVRPAFNMPRVQVPWSGDPDSFALLETVERLGSNLALQ